MATKFRLKRRVSGAAGAPATLDTAELAWNMSDGNIYGGFGDNGSGVATSIKIVAMQDFVNPVGVYQPIDADLTNLAGLDSTAGYLVKTGAGTHVKRTLTGTAQEVAITNGDGTTGNPVLSLAAVTIAGAGSGAGYTKVTVDTKGRVTNTGQAVLNDIGTATGDYGHGGFKITSVGTPTAGTDAATKAYVDSVIQGLDPKQSVRLATNAALPASTYATQTITETGNGALSIDGVAAVAGDRVLIKDEVASQRNGIYDVTNAGSAGTQYVLTRALDMDSWLEIPGATVLTELGTANADKGWLATADQGGTLGTTAIAFSLFGSSAGGGFTAAGDGLTSSGVTVNVVGNNGLLAAVDSIGLTGQALSMHNATIAADQLLYGTGAGVFATTGLTAVARTLIAQTTQALMRSTGLGLGDMALQNKNAVDITGGTIDGIILDGGTF